MRVIHRTQCQSITTSREYFYENGSLTASSDILFSFIIPGVIEAQHIQGSHAVGALEPRGTEFCICMRPKDLFTRNMRLTSPQRIIPRGSGKIRNTDVTTSYQKRHPPHRGTHEARRDVSCEHIRSLVTGLGIYTQRTFEASRVIKVDHHFVQPCGFLIDSISKLDLRALPRCLPRIRRTVCLLC